MMKKLMAIIMIVLLVGTIGAASVSSSGFIFIGERPTFRELLNKWEEIQSEKQELRDILISYGVELPDLTVDQKREIFRTIIQLRRQGSEREEILEVIFDLLIDFGMDLPDITSEQFAEIRVKIKTMLEEDYGFVFIELTEEQRQEIRDTIKDMKNNGATREEIKLAIIDLYESYGGVIPELNDIEKEEIHDWVVNMLETDYGFDLPDLTFDQRQEIKEKRSDIRELQKELRDMFRNARLFTKFRFLIYIRNNLN